MGVPPPFWVVPLLCLLRSGWSSVHGSSSSVLIMASIIAMPFPTLAVRVMRPDRDGADEGEDPPEDKRSTSGSPDEGNSSSLSFTQEQEEELTQTDEESGVDLMSSAEEQSGEDLMRSQ